MAIDRINNHAGTRKKRFLYFCVSFQILLRLLHSQTLVTSVSLSGNKYSYCYEQRDSDLQKIMEYYFCKLRKN